MYEEQSVEKMHIDVGASFLTILKLCIPFIKFYHEGSVILLENLRFHIEEEGKGVDSEGNKVLISVQMKAMHSEVLL